MIIIRFGETYPDGKCQWYETPAGKLQCTESVIDKLWMEWVNSEDSKAHHTKTQSIFQFGAPVSMEI